MIECKRGSDITGVLREQFKAGGFFGSPVWISVLVKAYGSFTDGSYYCEFPSGGKYYLPAVRKKRLIGNDNLYAMPFGTYSGLYAEGKWDVSEASEVFKTITDSSDISSFDFYPGPGTDYTKVLPGGAKIIKNCTHIASLSDNSADIWGRLLTSKCRNQVRKAEKEGVTVETIDSYAGLKDFHDAYVRSQDAAGGRKTYPLKLLKALLEAENAGIRVAVKSGKIAAGAVILEGGGSAFYWLGFSTPEKRKLCPGNLLLFRIMEQLSGRGVREFNMGASAGSKGVEDFKESFGAIKRYYNSHHYSKRKS